MKKWFVLFLGIILFLLVINFSLERQTSNTISDSKDFSTIIVPVKVHIISEDFRIYSSERDEENIISLIGEANRIWEQGGIHFQIEGIVTTKTSAVAISNALEGNYFELTSHENFDENVINVFLSKNLEGINGLAVSSIKSTFVADYTTVNDFRATAHEFGHILGLNHVGPTNRLMARGRNGELLTAEEILVARGNAEEF